MRGIIVFMLMLTVFLGCAEEDVTNSPPIIDLLVAPEQVNGGDSVHLQVVAHDVDGDHLTYSWKADKGEIGIPSGNAIKWTAPLDETRAEIVVYATDGINDYIVQVIIVKIVPAPKPDPPEQNVVFAEPVFVEPVATEPPPATVTIKPAPLVGITGGKSLSGIRLGQTLEEVVAIFGTPLRDGKFFGYGNHGISGAVENGKITQLLILAPNTSLTVLGNGIGSHQDDVFQEFGEADLIEREVGGDGFVHWYWSKGIAFGYGMDAKVKFVSVFAAVNRAPAVIPRRR